MNDGKSVFAIATVFLPAGGRIGVCRLPGLLGNLAGDIRAVTSWTPGIVVSMTEQVEMNHCGSGGLGAKLVQQAIDWYHLPIRDYGGPSGAQAERWPALASRLHHLLDVGQGVLLHCRGGHGRSGMIALRLMIERGELPSTALARLRAVRPGAVETDAQLQWATYGR